MKKRFVVPGMVLAVLALFAASAAAQFEHPDLKSGKRVVNKVVVLPPRVQITKSGVKGAEPLVDESLQVETALPGLIAKVLSEHGCAGLDNPFTAQALEKDSDMKYALADLQGRFDEVSKKIELKPKDVRQGRFTMGDDVTKLNPGGSADALVFVRGAGVTNTGGKKAFAVLFGVGGAASAFDSLFIHITVVDALTGNVLYYGNAAVMGNITDSEKMTKSIGKSFKNFVGPAASAKNPPKT